MTWLFLIASLAGSRFAAAQSQDRDLVHDPPQGGGAQGSFRPPLVSLATDTTYVGGAGLLAFAGPMTLFGAVVGFGHPFGASEHPLFAYEVMVDAVRGSGTFGSLPAELGGELDLGIVQGGGSATIKLKPLDARRNGYVGALLYATASLGMMQTSMSTQLGTAYLAGTMLGANGGVVVEGRILGIADVMLFGGYRVNRFETPTAPDIPGVTRRAPEYGGDVTVHVISGLDVKLSSVFTQMRQGDDDKGVKVFLLGINWQPNSGVTPLVSGEKP